MPEQGLLYSFAVDGRTILFNGDNLALVRVPQHFPALLGAHVGRSVAELRQELRTTNRRADLAALDALGAGGFFEVLPEAAVRAGQRNQAAAIAARERLNNIHLQVCSSCNLCCQYCYADGGSFQNRQPRGFLDVDTADAFIRFYLDRSEEVCFLNLLGGEPLLNPYLREIIDRFLAAAAERGQVLTMQVTTNGTSVTDSWADFLTQRRVRVAVSLDGNAAVHDEARPSRDGRGSHAGALAGLRRLVARDRDLVSVRVTCGHHNSQRLVPFYEWIVSEVGDVGVDLSPVIVDPAHALSLRPADLAAYTDALAEMNRRVCERRLDRPTELARRLKQTQIHQRQRLLIQCSPGQNLLAVSIHGDIYPCVPFLGRPEYRLGNMRDASWKLSVDARALLAGRGVADRPGCRRCWARYLCAGGCLAVNARHAGDPHGVNDYVCSIYRAAQAGRLKGYVMASAHPEPSTTAPGPTAEVWADSAGMVLE